MKRKKCRVIKRKAKRLKKRKKPLTKEQIKDRVAYYCTSLIQLASCEILKNYKSLLKENWHTSLNFEVQEHLIRAMLYKRVLSSEHPNRCKRFLTLICNYKIRNLNYSEDVLFAEKYVDKKCIICSMQKEIRCKKYASSPAFNHLKKNLTDASYIKRLPDASVQVILGSFVYLFDPTCKKLLYADGHENEDVTCSVYVAIGKKKRLFVGYSDGHVLFIPVGGVVLSGDVDGRIIDIVVHQENEEIVRAGILYKKNSEQKVRFVRALENKESQWFLDSKLHVLAAENTVESMEFDEGQLVTETSNAEQTWDFFPNFKGDLQVKNTHTIFLN